MIRLFGNNFVGFKIYNTIFIVMINKKTAFTLIELLTSITIIGILATTSIATFSGYFEKARIAKAQHFYSETNQKLSSDTIASGLTPIANCSLDSAIDNNSIDCMSGYKLVKTNGVFSESNFSTDTPLNQGKSFTNGEVSNSGIPLSIGNGIVLSCWMKNDPTDVSFNNFQINMQNGPSLSINLQNMGPSNSLVVFSIEVSEIEQRGYSLSKNLLKADDKWHHVLGSYNNTLKIASLYFDGILQVSQTVTGVNNFPIDKFLADMFLGASSSKVDNCKIYPMFLNKIQTNEVEITDGGDGIQQQEDDQQGGGQQ
jgi:prepilin-type N-terminal cleavage/methylation domain-containing protein